FRVLLVKGMIENPTQQEQPVPQIKAEILDQRGNLLNEWTFAPSFTSLPAGASEDFNAQLSNPPSGIRSVQFDFDLVENGGEG
ncbi:MAG: FxLYD domain-containing protein, partial [Alphaproteobacteria bacterium]|nr:FxLYD domain-containing protein [Alphaproteobacteria bacterium]